MLSKPLRDPDQALKKQPPALVARPQMRQAQRSALTVSCGAAKVDDSTPTSSMTTPRDGNKAQLAQLTNETGTTSRPQASELHSYNPTPVLRQSSQEPESEQAGPSSNPRSLREPVSDAWNATPSGHGDGVEPDNAKPGTEARRPPVKKPVQRTVILRPAGRFAVKNIPARALQDEITAVGGPDTSSYRIRIQVKANVIAIDTWSDLLVPCFLGITSVKTPDGAAKFTTYEAVNSNQVRGVFYGLCPEDTAEDLMNNLSCINRTIVSARPLGSQGNVALVTFEGHTLPNYVLYRMVVKPIVPCWRTGPACHHCHRLGHKSDICPHPEPCRAPGGEAPEAGHPCTVQACGKLMQAVTDRRRHLAKQTARKKRSARVQARQVEAAGHRNPEADEPSEGREEFVTRDMLEEAIEHNKQVLEIKMESRLQAFLPHVVTTITSQLGPIISQMVGPILARFLPHGQQQH